MGIIFDLDLTLIDSSLAKSAREERNWGKVYSHIPSFSLYTGILELLNDIRANGIKICIVTSSPSSYCERVLKHWNIPYDYTVCYHDYYKLKYLPKCITFPF